MTIFARIDKRLERKFRIRIVELYGSQKGGMANALEEAITLWLSKTEGRVVKR